LGGKVWLPVRLFRLAGPAFFRDGREALSPDRMALKGRDDVKKLGSGAGLAESADASAPGLSQGVRLWWHDRYPDVPGHVLAGGVLRTLVTRHSLHLS